MGKIKNLQSLTNLLTLALRHRIGIKADKNQPYANKYQREADNFFESSRKAFAKENWNRDDLAKMKKILKDKLIVELEKKDFISDMKFDIMDEEIDKILGELRTWTK